MFGFAWGRSDDNLIPLSGSDRSSRGGTLSSATTRTSESTWAALKKKLLLDDSYFTPGTKKPNTSSKVGISGSSGGKDISLENEDRNDRAMKAYRRFITAPKTTSTDDDPWAYYYAYTNAVANVNESQKNREEMKKAYSTVGVVTFNKNKPTRRRRKEVEDTEPKQSSTPIVKVSNAPDSAIREKQKIEILQPSLKSQRSFSSSKTATTQAQKQTFSNQGSQKNMSHGSPNSSHSSRDGTGGIFQPTPGLSSAGYSITPPRKRRDSAGSTKTYATTGHTSESKRTISNSSRPLGTSSDSAFSTQLPDVIESDTNASPASIAADSIRENLLASMFRRQHDIVQRRTERLMREPLSSYRSTRSERGGWFNDSSSNYGTQSAYGGYGGRRYDDDDYFGDYFDQGSSYAPSEGYSTRSRAKPPTNKQKAASTKSAVYTKEKLEPPVTPTRHKPATVRYNNLPNSHVTGYAQSEYRGEYFIEPPSRKRHTQNNPNRQLYNGSVIGETIQEDEEEFDDGLNEWGLPKVLVATRYDDEPDPEEEEEEGLSGYEPEMENVDDLKSVNSGAFFDEEEAGLEGNTSEGSRAHDFDDSDNLDNFDDLENGTKQSPSNKSHQFETPYSMDPGQLSPLPPTSAYYNTEQFLEDLHYEEELQSVTYEQVSKSFDLEKVAETIRKKRGDDTKSIKSSRTNKSVKSSSLNHHKTRHTATSSAETSSSARVFSGLKFPGFSSTDDPVIHLATEHRNKTPASKIQPSSATNASVDNVSDSKHASTFQKKPDQGDIKQDLQQSGSATTTVVECDSPSGSSSFQVMDTFKSTNTIAKLESKLASTQSMLSDEDEAEEIYPCPKITKQISKPITSTSAPKTHIITIRTLDKFVTLVYIFFYILLTHPSSAFSSSRNQNIRSIETHANLLLTATRNLGEPHYVIRSFNRRIFANFFYMAAKVAGAVKRLRQSNSSRRIKASKVSQYHLGKQNNRHSSTASRKSNTSSASRISHTSQAPSHKSYLSHPSHIPVRSNPPKEPENYSTKHKSASSRSHRRTPSGISSKHLQSSHKLNGSKNGSQMSESSHTAKNDRLSPSAQLDDGELFSSWRL